MGVYTAAAVGERGILIKTAHGAAASTAQQRLEGSGRLVGSPAVASASRTAAQRTGHRGTNWLVVVGALGGEPVPRRKHAHRGARR